VHPKHLVAVAGTKREQAWSQPPSAEEIARTLEMSRAVGSVGDLAETVSRNPSSTIEPRQVKSDALGRQALRGLVEERPAGIASGLAMGVTIGEGGMGLVRAATQRALGRRVAVKTLRPDVKDEQATLRLLREAWVTGALEHPNIVPIYDLGLGDDGKPVIVMKHIEGLAWCDLIHDAAAVKERFGAEDLLEHNLRILVQLCNAVSLAHARGVLHRDLKPENVMIGSFGEVYLVDWGIAVSLQDDPTGRMPLASQSKEIAGTPCYMAPEMLGAMGSLGVRTDVYLLGAILHEIIARRPPHAGENFRAIVSSILLSKFTFSEDAPPELVKIATRAMSRAAEERFASADELRQEIEWYLRHRGSLALSEQATLRVGEMRTVLARGGDPDEVRDQVNRLFAEARFGFRQAIRASGDNTAARVGLREATEMVVVFELAEGMPEAASAALAELDDPPPELVKRVADAMRAREAEKARVAKLEQLELAHDSSIGRRTRMAGALMLGALWMVMPQVVSYASRRRTFAPREMYVGSVAILLACVCVGVWGRESLSKTILNRRVLGAVLLMFAAQLTIQIGGHLLQIPLATLWVLHLYSWFVSAAAFAVLVEFRFAPTALAFLVAFIVAAARPEQCFNAMSAGNLALIINLSVIWSRVQEDSGYFVDRMRDRIEGQRQRRRRSG
jgi:eukaryotic-like serine/threonine-protein kinase